MTDNAVFPDPFPTTLAVQAQALISTRSSAIMYFRQSVIFAETHIFRKPFGHYCMGATMNYEGLHNEPVNQNAMDQTLGRGGPIVA